MMTFFAAVLPVIILFCGLTIDVGLIELRKIQMQTAADAAALGAELEVERGTGAYQALVMGRGDAAQNGFTDGTNTVSVTLAQQPAIGPYAGNYDAIQATITQQVKTIFMGTLNGGTVNVTAQAVSLIPPCAYFNGPNATIAYQTGTSGNNPGLYQLNAASAGFYSSCPVFINRGFRFDGFSSLYAVAENIGGAPSSSLIQGSVGPAARFNAPATTDPLATIPAPSFAGTCDKIHYTLAVSTQTTLIPGTYCGGITLTNANVTLSPGLYVITGGATWTGSTVRGTGVTLYFTQGGGFSYGQFNVHSSNLTLSAPTDGSQRGIPTILIFGDRSWVPTGVQDFQMSDSTFTGDGIWYTTASGIYFSNCGTITGPNYFAVDADNMYFYYTTIRPLGNFSSIATGSPFRPLGGLVQ